jgi:hypothetical protein
MHGMLFQHYKPKVVSRTIDEVVSYERHEDRRLAHITFAQLYKAVGVEEVQNYLFCFYQNMTFLHTDGSVTSMFVLPGGTVRYRAVQDEVGYVLSLARCKVSEVTSLQGLVKDAWEEVAQATQRSLLLDYMKQHRHLFWVFEDVG